MSESSKASSRIAILGAGEVGSVIAYSLILNPIAGEILLVDPKEEVRDAQIQDLSDATFHGNTTTGIRAGTHKEAGQCDIIIVTAGAAQKEGESRTDLIGKNLKILESALGDMKPFRDDAVILLVTNPVDVLTYFAQKIAGLPKGQVFGSGTFLDSARLRGLIGGKVGIAASAIDAYVLGEHGDSQMVAWSSVSVAGVPLDKVVPAGKIDKNSVGEDTKTKAGAIMKNKGATAFGIGGVASSICASILFDQRIVRPVSHYQEDSRVCFSMPAVIGRKGIVQTIQIPLSEQEKSALGRSSDSLREIIEQAENEST